MNIDIKLHPAINAEACIPRLRDRVTKSYGSEIKSLSIEVDDSLTQDVCIIDGSTEHQEVKWLHAFIADIGVMMDDEEWEAKSDQTAEVHAPSHRH